MRDDARLTLAETGITSSTVRRPALRSVECRVAAGPDAGLRVQIGQRPVSVGADGGCHLALSDARVSRHHVDLALVVGGVRVQDRRSTNGTLYQGSKITEAIVPVGSSIVVGETTLKLDAASAPSIPPSRRDRFGGLSGENAAMREIFAILSLTAPTDATTLIEGESGTGKELIARALHEHSERAEERLVVVDCSAISESLIDSHLFGHTKGAFTGAVEGRRGAIASADRGTLFLDEIGELPLPHQAKLLRALEERSVQAVGSDDRVQVDTRIVAATHRDLRSMVDAGTFRFDLYHRLAVVHVRVPALRERLDDLPILIRRFFEGRGVDPGPIDGENLDRLRAYAWPGNVRELRNVLERAWVLSPPQKRDFRALQIWIDGAFEWSPSVDSDLGLSFREAKERVVTQFERRYLAALWARHDYNVTRAAEAADLNRKTFRELLQKHDVEKP